MRMELHATQNIDATQTQTQTVDHTELAEPNELQAEPTERQGDASPPASPEAAACSSPDDAAAVVPSVTAAASPMRLTGTQAGFSDDDDEDEDEDEDEATRVGGDEGEG